MQIQNKLQLGNTEFYQKEVKAFCKDAGICYYTDLDYYRDFVQDCLEKPLPKNWQKQILPDGRVIYRNRLEKVYTQSHPSRLEFRKQFIDLLTQNRSPAISRRTGKRANTVGFPQKESFQITKFKTKTFDNIDDESKNFYMELIETEELKICNTYEWLTCSPAKMLLKADQLGIFEYPYLLWIARLALSLPLPPGWEEHINKYGEKIFINQLLKKWKKYHPAQSFLKQYVQLQKTTTQPHNNIAIFYNKQDYKQEINIIKLMQRKQYVEKQSKLKSKRILKLKFRYENQTGNNWQKIIALSKQFDTDFEENPQLLWILDYFLTKFWPEIKYIKTSEGLEYWKDQNQFWYEFPYVDEFNELLNNFKDKVMEGWEQYILIPDRRHPEYQFQKDSFINKANKMAKLMINYKLSQENSDQCNKLKKNLQERFQTIENNDDFLNFVFSCPFNMDKQINQQKELWQKVKQYVEQRRLSHATDPPSSMTFLTQIPSLSKKLQSYDVDQEESPNYQEEDMIDSYKSTSKPRRKILEFKDLDNSDYQSINSEYLQDLKLEDLEESKHQQKNKKKKIRQKSQVIIKPPKAHGWSKFNVIKSYQKLTQSARLKQASLEDYEYFQEAIFKNKQVEQKSENSKIVRQNYRSQSLVRVSNSIESKPSQKMQPIKREHFTVQSNTAQFSNVLFAQSKQKEKKVTRSLSQQRLRKPTLQRQQSLQSIQNLQVSTNRFGSIYKVQAPRQFQQSKQHEQQQELREFLSKNRMLNHYINKPKLKPSSRGSSQGQIEFLTFGQLNILQQSLYSFILNLDKKYVQYYKQSNFNKITLMQNYQREFIQGTDRIIKYPSYSYHFKQLYLKFGNPIGLVYKVPTWDNSPQLLLQKAKQLNLRVSKIPYESIDSDLL